MAVAIAASVLAVLAPASVGALTKRSGGITYAYKRANVNGGIEKIKVHCPRDMHVVGGGEANGLTYNQLTLHHSYPIDGRDRRRTPDDGWESMVSSAGPSTFEPYAICIKRRVRYSKQTLAANSFGVTNQVVPCPGRLNLVMGGTRGSQELRANSGFNHPEGWALFIENQLNQPLPFTGFATCVRFGVSLASATNNAFPPGQGFLQASCPPGRHVVGGGLSSGFGFGESHINSTFPARALDPTDQIGRHWSVFVDNLTAANGSVTAQAVCSRSLRR
jgi:hypothetical protein